jgi:hypothetical protein
MGVGGVMCAGEQQPVDMDTDTGNGLLAVTCRHVILIKQNGNERAVVAPYKAPTMR